MGETRVAVVYAAADETVAERIMAGLARAGFAPAAAELEAGTAPDGAKLLVLWSAHAAYAHGTVRRVLRNRPGAVVARLDAARPPAGPGVAVANLQHWRGRADHRGWQALRAALAGLKPSAAPRRQTRIETPAPEAAPALADRPAKPKGRLAIGLGVAALLCVIAVASVMLFG